MINKYLKRDDIRVENNNDYLCEDIIYQILLIKDKAKNEQN